MASIKWTSEELKIASNIALRGLEVAKITGRSLKAVQHQRNKLGITRKLLVIPCKICGCSRTAHTTRIQSTRGKERIYTYFASTCRKCELLRQRSPAQRKRELIKQLAKYHSTLKHDPEYIKKKRRQQKQYRANPEIKKMLANYEKEYRKNNPEKIKILRLKKDRRACALISDRYLKHRLYQDGFNFHKTMDSKTLGLFLSVYRVNLQLKRLIKQKQHEKAKKHE